MIAHGPCVCLCSDCVNGRGHCGGLDCGQSGRWVIGTFGSSAEPHAMESCMP